MNKTVIISEDGERIVILRGFIINYLEEEVLVYIERASERAMFELGSVETMGKGYYLFHPPNVSEVLLRVGEYKVWIITGDEDTKEFTVEITEDMRLPFTLEIEE